MAVRSKNHTSATGLHFTHELMNDGLVRRNENATEFLCRRQTKNMVILVDRPPHCTKTVMAVCQYVRNGKLLQPACHCRLNDANEGNVMRCKRIELQCETFHVSARVMRFQNAIGDCFLACCLFIRHPVCGSFLFRQKLPIRCQICALFI